MFHRLLFLLTLTVPLSAQDGGQLFTLYCSACHGADGKGATGGAFPPLANSPWVAGDANRAVKIVLKGMGGTIEVLGKSYNLEMPPQGAALKDDQIAAILTYVRSSWGNQAGAVSEEFVKAAREATKDRAEPWSPREILLLHPLPLQKTALSDLTSQVYKGSWKFVPDFSKLKAENVEEEHDGIISIKDATLKTDFGMVWEGKLEIPADGDYLFSLDADDSAKIFIDGEQILDIPGIGPMNGSRGQKSIEKLTKGSHRFRAEYVQFQGNKGIAIGWKPAKDKEWRWLTDEGETKGKAHVPIPVEPAGGRPVIYRNFIAGTTTRSIGVGFPGGLNLAYSADHLAPELIWTGKFIDGSYKWDQRGTDNNPPAGEKVVSLTKTRLLPENARFKGYKLDSSGNPTFAVEIGTSSLLDSWHAESNTLVRKLTLSGKGAPIDLVVSDHAIGGQITLTAEGAALQTVDSRTTIKLDPGHTVTLTYRWK